MQEDDQQLGASISDQDLATAWREFQRTYASLGYRRATFDLFAMHLKQRTKLRTTGAEIQRRLHAFRKRLRTRRGT